MDFLSFRDGFNKHLSAYIELKASQYRLLTDEPLIWEAFDHMTKLVERGGKRIRPYLSYLAYTTEGGKNDAEAMRLGLSLELFHVFALIHDDIIDEGIERHGMPTIQMHMREKMMGAHRAHNVHLADGMAMLIGDLLFGWSEEVIAALGNTAVQELFFTMIEQIVIGQMLDVSFMTKPTVTKEAIAKKNEMKTARYSFLSPMLTGAALAGSDRRTEWYTKLGLVLGQAFQMQDDLLDIVGSEKTGKKTFMDIEDGQHTFLSQYVFDQGAAADREALRSRFGAKLTDDDRKTLLALFMTTGAVADAEKQIDVLFGEAKELIESAHLESVQQEKWLGVVAMLDKRSS
jgi:geranylgeranyl diphosphate synthase type I